MEFQADNQAEKAKMCHVTLLVFDISRASGGAAPLGLVRLCQHRRPRFNKVVLPS